MVVVENLWNPLRVMKGDDVVILTKIRCVRIECGFSIVVGFCWCVLEMSGGRRNGRENAGNAFLVNFGSDILSI